MPSFTLQQVVDSLAPLFKVSHDSLRPQLETQSFIAKLGVDLQTAAKYEGLLRQHGCVCVVEPEQHYQVSVLYRVGIRELAVVATNEQAIAKLAALLKITADALRTQLHSGNFTARRGIALQEAANFADLLNQYGCVCIVEPEYQRSEEPLALQHVPNAVELIAPEQPDAVFLELSKQLENFLATPGTPAHVELLPAKPKPALMIMDPHCSLEKFPRILNKISLLWGHPECETLISTLVIDDRGNRQGFGLDIMDELLFLAQITTLVCMPDASDAAARKKI